MTKHRLNFSDWDEDYAKIVEAKGWYPIELLVDGKVINLEFYDQVRLSQEIGDAIRSDGCFTDSARIIVIAKVTRKNMVEAVEKSIKVILG